MSTPFVEDEPVTMNAGRMETTTVPGTIEEAAPGSGGLDGESLGAIGFLNVLLRRRWLVIGCAVLFTMAAVAWKLIPPRTYTATASFTAQTAERGGADIGLMASSFGVNVSSGDRRSPEFYAEVLRSQNVQRALVETRYPVAANGSSGEADLVVLFGIDPEPRDRAVAKAVRDLRDAMGIGVDPVSGIVAVSISTASPELSTAILDRALELLNDFNVGQRQSQASAERSFIEGRLDEARADLQQAERDLQEFLDVNRRIESPQLLFSQQRLQREVAIRQERVLSLVRSYEQARVDEIRNLPVIVVLDPPVEPAFPDGRGTVFAVLFALLLGAGVGAAVAYVREKLARARSSNDPEWQEFDRLRRRIFGDGLLGGRSRQRGTALPPCRAGGA